MQSLTIANEREPALADLAQSALERARAAGAAQAEAGVSEDRGLSLTARMRDIETIEFQEDRSFGITVYIDQCKGSATTSDFGAEAIAEAVDKAVYIARQTSPDPCAGLADADRMATVFPDLGLDHDWDIDMDAAQALALETEAAALDHDARISNSEGATTNLHRGLSLYANSHGFQGTQRRSRYSLSCAVIAGDGDAMQRDYHYTSDRNPGRLETPAAVGSLAAQRTMARLKPRKIDTQSAPVVYRADVARGLFGHLLSAVSGSAQYRKASFLLDAVGQSVLPEAISIVERPFLPGAAGSTAFDAEGVATRERDIVGNGELQGYVLSSYSARRLGLETTGNAGGVHNAIVSSTAGDLDAILAQMGTGLLVTELMGQGVNTVTGDYSRGAAGFWVENGALAYPVAEITIAANLADVYRNIAAVGSDVDARGSLQCGSALVSEMRIAGA
ncbi:MAG: metalloprotease PmbA [Pseudomonadota bacterium]